VALAVIWGLAVAEGLGLAVGVGGGGVDSLGVGGGLWQADSRRLRARRMFISLIK
jgi:hypothetical protein